MIVAAGSLGTEGATCIAVLRNQASLDYAPIRPLSEPRHQRSLGAALPRGVLQPPHEREFEPRWYRPPPRHLQMRRQEQLERYRGRRPEGTKGQKGCRATFHQSEQRLRELPHEVPRLDGDSQGLPTLEQSRSEEHSRMLEGLGTARGNVSTPGSLWRLASAATSLRQQELPRGPESASRGDLVLHRVAWPAGFSSGSVLLVKVQSQAPSS